MKRDYPATERNKHALLDALHAHLPKTGTVLEIASGSGQHAVHFAAGLPKLKWQPSSREEEERASIAAYAAEAQLPNLLPALSLDVTAHPWPVTAADAIVCINMIHIAPWAASEGLFSGAAQLLKPGTPLITYGPYKFEGEFTSPSNAQFDASLQRRDPDWGVRDVVDLDALAARAGFARTHTAALPANNHVLVWLRQ